MKSIFKFSNLIFLALSILTPGVHAHRKLHGQSEVGNVTAKAASLDTIAPEGMHGLPSAKASTYHYNTTVETESTPETTFKKHWADNTLTQAFPNNSFSVTGNSSLEIGKRSRQNCSHETGKEFAKVRLSNCSKKYNPGTSFQSNLTNLDPCRQPTTPLNTFLVALLIIVMIITLLGNTAVVFTVLHSRLLRNEIIYHFIASLAISDTMFALFTLPVKVEQFLSNQHFCKGITLCYYLYITDHTFNVASITHLQAISIDRLLGIMLPYTYSDIVTKKRSRKAIGTVWLYSIIWASLSTFNWTDPRKPSIYISRRHSNAFCINKNKLYYTLLYSAVFIFNLFIMIIIYVVVLKTTLRHAKAIRANEVHTDWKRKRDVNLSQLKVTKTAAMVFSAFLISFLPACVITLSSLYNPEHYRRLLANHPDIFRGIYIAFIQILPLLNACINPFIYAFMSSNFRQTIIVIFWRSRGRYMSDMRYAYCSANCRVRRVSMETDMLRPRQEKRDSLNSCIQED